MTESHSSLLHVAQRPWPLPESPWLMSQRWSDLMFLHWPVPAAQLRRLIPSSLAIEEHGGSAWVAVTPFLISDMRAGPVPLPPFRMPELNVRTYVSDGRRPGVWFMSLDAGSRLAVLGARLTYRLPYIYSVMSVRRSDGTIAYRSARPDGTSFSADASPLGSAAPTAPGSFSGWCVERYCLYTGGPGRSLWTADIHHAPWRLAPASAAIQRNDMLKAHGLEPEGEMAPAWLAEPIDVLIWPLRRVRSP